jgi:potassium efflux system protein
MNIHVIATRSAAGSFRCGLQNNRKPFDQRRPANRITQRRTTGLAWPLLLAILASSPAPAQQIQLPSKPEAALQPVQPQPNQARTNQVTPATATATAAAIPTPAATSGAASAQSVAPTTITPRADAVSNSDAARIKQAIDTLRKDDSLAEEIRRSSEEVLVRALKYIERRDKANAQTRQLKAAADSAAARKQAAEAATERPVEVDREGVSSDSPAADIETLIKRLEADLASATARSKAIQEQVNSRRTESKELPRQIAEFEGELAAIKPPPADDGGVNPLVAQALQGAADAEKQAAEAELQLARQKLVTYEAEAPVLPLEQQQFERRAAAITSAIGQVSRWRSRRRQDDVAAKISDFLAAAEADPATVAAELEETIELFDEWPPFLAELQSWNTKLLRLHEATEALRNDFHETESLVESDRATGSGLSRSAGSLLKRKRVMLGRTRSLLDSVDEQAAAVDDAQDMLADIDTLIDELDQRKPDVPQPDAPQKDLPTIAKRQRTLLEAMNNDIDRGLIDTLIPLGVQLGSLSHQIKQYDQLIDTNLLWVRSDKPLRLVDVTGLVRVTSWLELGRLETVAQSLVSGIAARPIQAGAILIAIIGFIVLHRWFVLRVIALGGSLSGANAMRLWPTLQALVFTVFAALPVWLPLAAISWFLGEFSPAESTEAFTADALWVAGLVFLPLEVLRQLIRPHGVAVDHFAWSDLVVQPLRRAVSRTALLGLGLVFLARLLLLERNLHSELSPLARIVFSILMIFVAAVFRRLLDPKKGVTAAIFASRPGGLLARMAWLWRPFVVAMPLLLAGLSLSGYAFAATELTVSLYKSIWIIVSAAVFQGVAMRWLLVSKRRIALQQLKERSALREQAEAAGAASEMLHVNQMKLSAIDQQTRRLIDAVIVVGVFVTLFWIWSPVLPALSFLDSVVLWEMRAADGTVTSVVALSNVLVAIPTLLLTFVLVHNVPGLLEAALLRRLPLDNATRYAITTLTSYLLALCGMLLAAGTIGLRWSSVQWLAAGLSVGLGFGLQEVVANFVCGLILLFEQPIRVGDVVTLDSISGVVSRIRIRATTVTTWERQEYVIPNKDLITGRVINWTLSDSVNRAELTVGVAYGTDTRRVIELLGTICSGIPDILADPAPIITFEQFGDSTLNLVVRFYLASLDNRLGTISELHSQIHERFNAEGIEIAFPQVDVHMKPEPPV